MTFLDRQEAIKADRERKQRLWGKPQATVLKFRENCVGLPVEDSQAPRSSTTAEVTEKPPEAVSVPIMAAPAEEVRQRLDEINQELNNLFARVRELRAEMALREEAVAVVATAKTAMLAVSQFYGVSMTDIKSDSKIQEIVKPRHVGMYLAKELGRKSLPAIGRAFGGKDHTTCLHAWRSIKERRKHDAKLNAEIEEISTSLREKSNGC